MIVDRIEQEELEIQTERERLYQKIKDITPIINEELLLQLHNEIQELATKVIRLRQMKKN